MLKSLFSSEYCEIYKSTYFEEHMRTAVSANGFTKLRIIENHSQRNFNFTLKKQGFSASISGTSENVCFHLLLFALNFNQ